MIARLALPLIASLVLPVTGQAPARDDPAALAAALQERYARVHDFSATFVHELRGRRSPPERDGNGPRAHQEAWPDALAL